MRNVYLDNNATSPLLPEVLEAMRPYFIEKFGNASSSHQWGRRARAAVEQARKNVASLLGANSAEILFTGGGTEGDNMALFGLVSPGDHAITSAIEHPAILNTCKKLEWLGVEVTYVGVNSSGQLDIEDVRKALKSNTKIISVMFANNETGVVQPLREIGHIASENDIWFHTDAVQAAGKIPIDVNEIGCDLLTISGHKFNAPQGTGALYVRKGTPLQPHVFGGHQERGLRPGTENLLGIVGLGEAARCAQHWLGVGGDKKMRALRDHLEEVILEELPLVHVNGRNAPRSPNTSNLSFECIMGRDIAVLLDEVGVGVSTGSACASGTSEPPYVLMAMGMKPEQAYASIRISLGKLTTAEDVEYVIEQLIAVVSKLRDKSPVWNKRKAQAASAPA